MSILSLIYVILMILNYDLGASDVNYPSQYQNVYHMLHNYKIHKPVLTFF